MNIIPIYRYSRADGGITDSPKKPEGVEYTERVRLVADDGKMLTRDGVELCPAIDADSAEGWAEVDAPATEEETVEEATDEVPAAEE